MKTQHLNATSLAHQASPARLLRKLFSHRSPTPRSTASTRTLGPECLETRLNLSLAPAISATALFAPDHSLYAVRPASAVAHAQVATGRLAISGWGQTAGAATTPRLVVATQTQELLGKTPAQAGLGATTLASSATSVPITSYASIYNCQLETRSSGQDIGWVSTAGAYVDYVVNAPTAGSYDVTLGLAALNGASLNLLVNGAQAASYAVPVTGGWDSYTSMTQTVTLAAGQNILRLASTNGTQYNLNAMTVAPSSAAKPTAGTITVGSSTTSVAIASYSAISNEQLETRSSGSDLGWVSPSGAYVEYALNVQTAGSYQLNLGLAAMSNASLTVLANGSQVASFSIPATGSWDAYSTLSQNINLTAGTVTLRIASANGTQYNLNAIGLAPASTPAPAPAPTPVPITSGPAATVSQQWMTSFSELDITGTTGNDAITISQSGSTITINANGNVQTVTGSFGDLVVRGNGGNDTITIDSSVTVNSRLYGGTGIDTLKNLTQGKATIVAIGGSYDVVQGNGLNTSYWVDSTDSVTASSAEQAAGRVHTVSSFYNGVSTTLSGQNLADPSANGSVVRLTNSSFWGTGPSREDVVQGQVADCYFTAPLASLAQQQPDRLREMAVDLGDGTYAIQFKRNGVTTYVRVDGDLPAAGPYANGLWASHPGASGNQWAALFEKAYAFYRSGAGTYSSLNYGWSSNTLSDLGVANNNLNPGTDANTYYNTVSSALASGKALVYGTVGSITGGAPLVGSHAYSLVAAWRDASGNPVFQLRNPWGFDGAGSDANAWDGLVTLTYSQMAANNSGSVYSLV